MGPRRLILSLLVTTLGVLAFASTTALALEGHVFSKSFGQAGPGAGEMELGEGALSGVAVDNATHDVYVADTGNARVDEFEADGTFVRAWGWGVADGLAKAETCTLVCEKGLGGSGAGQPTSPTAIAVDNSGGSSQGDVYVADSTTNVVSKFSATGEFISSNDGSAVTSPIAGPFGPIAGIAVDSSGDLWVYDLNAHMFEFFPGGAFATDWNSGRGVQAAGIAVDESSDLDVVTGAPGVASFSPTGTQIGNIEEGIQPTGLGVDTSSSGGLFVDQGNAISHYPVGCEPAQGFCTATDSFGVGVLSGGTGIGLDSSNGDVYAADNKANRIDVFTSVVLPGVVSGEATDPAEGSATLTGTVEPEGEAITSCKFEYVADSEYEPSVAEPYAKGATATCEPSPATTTMSVRARIKSLVPGTLYHYRLVAVNKNGGNSTSDRTFRGGAVIEAQSIADVESNEANVKSTIEAGGQPTSYRVEYGLTSEYGNRTAPAEIGQSSGNVNVAAHLGGLQPASEYHFRFVVTDPFGSSEGADETFTTAQSTAGVAAAALPDGRAYELVSSANDPGEVYVPGQYETNPEDLKTHRPFAASRDGDAVAYVSEPSASRGSGSQGNGLGDEFLARRDSKGWSASDAMPSVPISNRVPYEAFSGDLSQGIFVSTEGHPPPSNVNVASCPNVLWARSASDGSYNPLFTTTQTPGFCGYPVFAGASADRSQLLFQTEAALITSTSQAAGPPPLGERDLRSYFGCSQNCNLYDSASGNLRLVNILPEGKIVPNATFGSHPVGELDGEPTEDTLLAGSFSNVISEDGTRIFWTDLEAGPNMEHIFVRENGTSTVAASAGAARFWTATPDGRFVFYSEGETFWRFDVDTDARKEIAGTGSGIQGVVGASSDGATVYFVATGVLASNGNSQGEKATQRICVSYEAQLRKIREEEKEGKISEEEWRALNNQITGEQEGQAQREIPPHTGCNLYSYREGDGSEFITVLAPEDNEAEVLRGPSGNLFGGDWQLNIGLRTAQLTPDGQRLVFESNLALAPGSGHDTKGTQSGSYIDIYTYDAGTGQVSCVSCAPSGAGAVRNETFLPVSGLDTYSKRVMSEDGQRVFFDSSQPLVAQETSGAEGVYEWERESQNGGCHEVAPARVDGGCISLLSGVGTGTSSYFADADATGDNVFFASRNQLVGPSLGGREELYDARVDGGFPESSLACTGAGCQGVPPAPPIFATPSSVTFSGVGNLPSSVGSSKSKKSAAKCAKGKKLSRDKCVKARKGKARKKTKRAGRNRGLRG
jgi:hypothetical protein